MAIPVKCSCGKTYKLKDEFAGQKVKCRECGKTLVVPVAEESAKDRVEEPTAAEPLSESVPTKDPKSDQLKRFAGKAAKKLVDPTAGLGFLKKVGSKIKEAAATGETCDDCRKDLSLINPNILPKIPKKYQGGRSAICSHCVAKLEFECPKCEEKWKLDLTPRHQVLDCPHCQLVKDIEKSIEETRDEFRGLKSWVMPFLYTDQKIKFAWLLKVTEEKNGDRHCYMELQTTGIFSSIDKDLDIEYEDSLMIKLGDQVEVPEQVYQDSNQSFHENTLGKLFNRFEVSVLKSNPIRSLEQEAILEETKTCNNERVVYWFPAEFLLKIQKWSGKLELRLRTRGYGEIDFSWKRKEYEPYIETFCRKMKIAELANKQAQQNLEPPICPSPKRLVKRLQKHLRNRTTVLSK